MNGRRGWMSAADSSGRRWRLAVFDDGWVELPGSDEAPTDTRAQLRRLAVLAGGFGVLVLFSQLAGRLDGTGPALSVVLSVGALGLVLTSVAVVARQRARDRSGSGGRAEDRAGSGGRAEDGADAVRARRGGGRVRRRPGAPPVHRARTSAELAARLDGVHRVAAEQVGAVVVTGPDRPTVADPLVVSVLRTDGSTRTYRTVDPAARHLFEPWTTAP